MREFLVTLVGVAFVLGVVYVTQCFYEETYSPPTLHSAPAVELPPASPPASAQEASSITHQIMPLNCAIVIAPSDMQMGTGIPELNAPAGDLGLLRPVGEMMAAELPSAASRYFQKVEVVPDAEEAIDADVIVDPGTWAFDGDTGYDLTGLALVYASGEAFVSGHLHVHVKLAADEGFELTESVNRVTIDCGGFVPVAQLRRIMTDATYRAITTVSEELMASIARDPRVRERVAVEYAASAAQ